MASSGLFVRYAARQERRNVLLPLLCLSCWAAACQTSPGTPDLDTPTTGAITIAVDESFQPLVQSQIEVFTTLYTRTSITARYTSEGEAVQDLLTDSVRLAIVSRDLTDAEKEVFQRVKITPRMIRIAVDGVALIVNRSNPDSLAQMQELKEIFQGTRKTWRHSGQPILVVFDSNNSSNLSFILRTFELENLDSIQVFATKSNQQVVEYVKTNPNALGVIGTNWIADVDDPEQVGFRNDVTVMSIAAVPNPTEDDYYQPYQAYLQLETYPLRRDVLVLSREARAGLGSGFMSFLASDRGQRIVLKSGLLPVTMPVRLVNLRDSF